jgi:hypothetical protein
MLTRVSDESELGANEWSEPPGEPLESGFEFRPARTVRQGRLSVEALRRVIDKMDSVEEARLRAARDGHSAYIG